MTPSNTPLKPLYWLYLPLLWMAAQIALELTVLHVMLHFPAQDE